MTQTQHSLTELSSLLDACSEPHVILDLDYRIQAANQAYRQQVMAGASAVGRCCYEVSHHYKEPCDLAGESCPLSRSMASGQRERVMHLHYTPNGEEYVDIELTPIRNASGAITHFVEKMVILPVKRNLPGAQGLLGRAPRFRQMLELVARVAKSDAVVLLEGESGSGKELVASALHQGSRRARQPFIPVDCSGIPDTLFESEFFGHERGAFTGATTRNIGLVEAASGGTLFLDEVGDIPLAMQVKLLRLLETGTYRRVGSAEIRRADIRVISATHRSLTAMVTAGSFRADLYYRLNVFPIRVPSLRERREDLPILTEALLQRVAPERTLTLSAAARAYLQAYPFPGNVRELRNLLERASLMCDGAMIEPEHMQGMQAPPPPASADAPIGAAADAPLRLIAPGGQETRRDLAARLGLSERTLYRRLRKLKSADD